MDPRAAPPHLEREHDERGRHGTMAQITAADVKKLRDATGAGMMDCKRALTEADGEYDKAVEILRVSGQAKAEKRGAERSATNGLVASVDGALLQLGAETDFVAKNSEFQQLAADAVKAAAAMCIAISRARLWKSSVRATKSDSQLTSTSTPILPPMWM